jgi:hypothetical protein
MNDIDIDEHWSLIIALNEIPSRDLGTKAVRFVRGVTLRFQEEGDLSKRQWLAIERFVQHHRPRHDFDPTTLASDCDE